MYGLKLISVYSGNSYTQTGFSAWGEQPTASNPMGNPQLGDFPPSIIPPKGFKIPC